MALDPRWSAVPLPAKLARWRVARAVTRARAARLALTEATREMLAFFGRFYGPDMLVGPMLDRATFCPTSKAGDAFVRCAVLEQRAQAARAEAPTFNSIGLVRWLTAARDEHDRRQAARRARHG